MLTTILCIWAGVFVLYQIIKSLYDQDWGVDNCTFFPEGNWTSCCWTHDHDCILAIEYLSPKMRLEADRKLFNCVYKRSKTIACIMYFGVRFWAYTYWWIGYWREYHEQTAR
jgi:hypothetical protein